VPLCQDICKKCRKKLGEGRTIKEHETKKTQCPKWKSEDLEHVIEPFFTKTSSKMGSW
jgi:hypothetical protein